MSISIIQKFPVVNKYLAELKIDSAGATGHAKITCQVRGISSSWDWYVNSTGWCYAYLYIDGTLAAKSDLATWGAHGSGLNGVDASEWVTLTSSWKVSKTSKIQLIIDCRKGPKIQGGGYGGKALGYLDTGEQTPNWSSVVSFLKAPVISSLYNNNKYNNQASVSASTTELDIGVSLSSSGDAPTTWQYSFDNKTWGTFSTNPFTLKNLYAGTSYTVYVKCSNAAGTSNTASITIRTRHNIPSLELTLLTDIVIDELVFEWKSDSDKACQSIAYKMRDISELGEDYTWDEGWSDWIYINLYNNENEGEITISDLTSGHTYELLVIVKSTSTYDSLSSAEVGLGVKSLRPAYLIEPLEYIFGENFSGTRNNASGKDNVLEFYNPEDLTTPIVYINFEGSGIENEGDIPFSIDITDSQWDTLYKLLKGVDTYIVLKVKLGTITDDKTIYNEYDGILTLTGNMKTMRVYSNDTVDRIKGWIMEQDQLVRCVSWVGGPDNKPVRCI